MGEVLVRASRDDDSPYLLWSTIVDAPTCVFTDRDQVLVHLRAEDERLHPGYQPRGPHTPEARLARADEHGTSAITPADAFGWGDDEFHVMAGAPAHVEGQLWMWWFLPRTRLADYARALLDEDEAAAQALLVPRPIDDGPVG